MNKLFLAYAIRRCAAGALCALASACGALLPAPTAPPARYVLDGAPARPVNAMPRPPSAPATVPILLPTLLVQPPRAAAGFDGRQIVYVREPHRLEHFARSEWADTPAHMLAPLIVAAVEATGSFRAVVPAASGMVGELRLDTEIVRLQQEFSEAPSRVRFTLRAYVLDGATRRVMAWREFDQTEPAASDDPPGGVVAANRAVQAVLLQLASFCTEAAAAPRPATAR